MKMHSQPACCIPPRGFGESAHLVPIPAGVPDMISPWWPATCLPLFSSRWQDQSAEVATVSDYPLAGEQLERKTEGATQGRAERTQRSGLERGTGERSGGGYSSAAAAVDRDRGSASNSPKARGADVHAVATPKRAVELREISRAVGQTIQTHGSLVAGVTRDGKR